MMKLTKRQHAVLEKIYDYILRNGYPPSIRDLAGLLGISSPRGISDHLGSLEKKGYMERKSSARSIRLTGKAIALLDRDAGERAVYLPLLGRIAAGRPILAAENIEERIPFPANMLKGAADFALRVQGDSMNGDHILDGDIIAVRSQSTADNGDIVVALIGDEAVVKRFYKRKDAVELRSSNPGYAPIIAGKELLVQGKVVAVQRMVS
jgi:repressor LexA